MSLAPGSRLGPYEVTAAIGAGGMGEVFRARDTKLNRDVAIKVLPAAFAQDGERVARFKREAQILASLNHPNIAAIYGLEESGGTLGLAMEYVAGEDLAERLARGAVPLDEAVAIAKQIAEALEEAHEHGIVHRDLKPANVKLTPEGKVKVLDFGLAKALEPERNGSGASSRLSHSPTVTSQGTVAGIILGTAAYMSPEQARGKKVDKRSDIWSFGVVLYEVLTGRRLFHGETVSDVLAAVLTREADWAALPAATPPAVVRVLRRCLERDGRRRLQSIAEARIVFEDPAAAESHAREPGQARRRAWWLPAAGAALLCFAAGWMLRPGGRTADTQVRKLDLAIGGLEVNLGRKPSVSPDGTRVAFVAGGRLQVRRLDRLDAVALPDGDDAVYPSWSPDSRQLAYVRHGRAWKVSSEGGPPTELGAVPTDLTGSGDSVWTVDGHILFSGSDTVGLWDIPAAGGAAGQERLALDRAAEADFHEIAALPEGRGLIFTVHPKGRLPDTIALLAGGSRRKLLEVAGESLRYPIYSSTGHILYERETTNPGIWAVPFSLDRLETTGAPFLVVAGGSFPSLARDGTLCFVRPDETPIELVRVSRAGGAERVALLAGTRASMLTRTPMGAGYRLIAGLSLSPDSTRIAISLGVSPGQTWVYDLLRGSLATIATGTFPTRAVWTTRGDRLFYGSSRSARNWNIWSRRADGVGEEERFSTSDQVHLPLALSPDGSTLVYIEGSGPSGSLRKMPAVAAAHASPVFPDRVWGLAAAFSPDGRFLVYDSTEAGRLEVYVRPFPKGDEKIQLSTGGGEVPVWTRSGEVVYIAGAAVASVSVSERGGSLAVSKPATLFQTGGDTNLAPAFDVTPDGRSFFMLRSSARQRLSLVLNWPQDLAEGTKKMGSER
jgi:serine/threonine-protein kinase